MQDVLHEQRQNRCIRRKWQSCQMCLAHVIYICGICWGIGPFGPRRTREESAFFKDQPWAATVVFRDVFVLDKLETLRRLVVSIVGNLSINLSEINQLTYLSVYKVSIRQHLSIYSSLFIFVYLSITIYQSIDLSIYISVYLCIPCHSKTVVIIVFGKAPFLAAKVSFKVFQWPCSVCIWDVVSRCSPTFTNKYQQNTFITCHIKSCGMDCIVFIFAPWLCVCWCICRWSMVHWCPQLWWGAWGCTSAGLTLNSQHMVVFSLLLVHPRWCHRMRIKRALKRSPLGGINVGLGNRP